MKAYFILGIICIVGTYASPIKKGYSPDILECAKESNFDIVGLAKLAEDKSFKPPEDYQVPTEFYCFVSCMDHKKGSEWTYYEEFMKLIKSADEDYHYFKDKSYTREGLENILNKCKFRGLNECGFLECIKYVESPIYKLNMYF